MIGYALAKYLPTIDPPLLWASTSTPLTYTGTTSATGNVIVGTMPAEPNECVGIFPLPGLPQTTVAPTDLPSVQLRTRAKSVHDAERMAHDIIDRLNCLDRVTLDPGGTDEVYVIGMTAAQSTPTPLGRDGNQRSEFTVSIDLRVHAPSTNRPATTGV